MSKKINDIAESIKSKLSFDEYKPSEHNSIKSSTHNDDITTKDKNSKKVRRTFYMLEGVAEQLDDLYARKIMEKRKIDKSDIVTQALLNLFENCNCEIERF